jgi:glycerol-3-phosphate acyltransferase PlsY
MIVFYVLLAYLLGSLPFSLLIARVYNVDLRRQGSGNIGATNVFRTLGFVPGILAFALDFGKGTLAVYLGYWAGGYPQLILLMGIAAIFGHMFSIFLGFKGGKGAATGLGVLAGLTPDIFIIAAVLTLIIILLTRYVSLASMLTSLAVAALMFVLGKPTPYALAALLVAVFIIIRHLPNISRLYKGIEPRVGA